MSLWKKPDGAAAGQADAPQRFERNDPPILSLDLWPNRSLPANGFRIVLVVLAIGLTAPLIPLIGTNLFWGMAPFEVLVFLGVYFALRQSYRDGGLTEELRLWPDLISVVRKEPKGRVLTWRANPHWVRTRILEEGKVEKYLTLRGGGREIELGAFLSPNERVELHRDINSALRGLKTTTASPL